MKAVILAGGLGTRLAEETQTVPKPMVTVGGRPLLWHLLHYYAHHGITESIICCGYKTEVIKDYFVNYMNRHNDLTVDMSTNQVEFRHSVTPPWRVTMVHTGLNTMTGGRLKRIREYLGDDEPFFCTYGDGLSNVDLNAVLAHHKREKARVTLTAATPPGRFGSLIFDDTGNRVTKFAEKPAGDGQWINAGFFVIQPDVLDDYVEGDETVWEQGPLSGLAKDGSLAAYRHDGFWQPMDTLNDRNRLEALWASGKAPWKVWGAPPA